MLSLTAHFLSYVDPFGEHKEWESKWGTDIVPGLGLNSECYVLSQNWLGKYYIQKCKVDSIWFTNIWGWKMTNGWSIPDESYGVKIFRHDELDRVIELCEKKNRYRKVKVKGLT